MNGLVVYDGPSQWDDEPIVVVITGIKRRSNNPKTGDMLQMWILRQDMHPFEALKTGADSSICGNCMHRPDSSGKRTCYVSMNAPGQVWKAYKAEKYPAVDPETAAEFVKGRALRLGAYGDPAMVPLDVLRPLVRNARLTTGYTHQWRQMPVEYREFCMASTDNEADNLEAEALGYRTFRCVPIGGCLTQNEIVCPASEEAGKLTTCDQCGLCAGELKRSNRIPNIAITVHGRGAKSFSGKSPLAVEGPTPNERD